MMALKYTIGRGKNMSIAKVALVFYFGEFKQEWPDEERFLEYGNLDAMHTIVDIAAYQYGVGSFVGIELDAGYYERAKKSINQAMQQQKLFEESIPKQQGIF